MPVRTPPDGAPEQTVELLATIDEEFAHDHCLFLVDTAFGGPGTPSTIWMYYPEDNDYYPENATYLAAITTLVEDVCPATYSHVTGLTADSYPDDTPPEATNLTKIFPEPA